MKVLGFSWENIIDTIKQGFEASFIYPSEKKNLSRSSHQFLCHHLKIGLIMKLERNRSFQKASHLMENTRQHLFITGKAGTGKSTLLDYFCKHTKKKPILLAPTGIAALNIQGQTIHKFFNFHSDITPEKIRTKEIKPRQPKIYKKLNMIIIDEVSMLRADLLDCIDTFLRLYGPQSTEAFGGVQLVFVGDLYQLPPVVSRHEISIFKSALFESLFFQCSSTRNYESYHHRTRKDLSSKTTAFYSTIE